MIAYLHGKVAEKGLENAVIDVNGIGYGVFMTSEDIGSISLNETVKLHIYEHVREQAYDLFGFCEVENKQFFQQLLDVNGVGPKMALSLMSLGSSANIRGAIAEGNVKYLQGASGVGKRLAERVVVELKDKVGLVASEDSTSFLQTNKDDEAYQALLGLGFNPNDASRALTKVDSKLPTEERVKLALKEDS
jgi:holliday junction DNA helicase RuvA